MTDENVVLTCVYCGHQYPDGTPAAKHDLLTDHIKVCEEHPLRAVELKLAAVHRALADMVGAESKQELDAMELAIRSTAAPSTDKALTINAIDALRMCMSQVMPGTVPENFVNWLKREMPAGTVIGDPEWWAPRIAKALRAAALQQRDS